MADTGTVKTSRERFLEALIQKISEPGAFVLLSGDSGSGRTTLCEQAVNALEGKFQTIFLPCTRDQDPSRLRELFLQQLLPGRGHDLDVNLPDALTQQNIPGRRKILVVADDIDTAVSGFFTELRTLCAQQQPSRRFSFLLSCHPLWAQEQQRPSPGPEIEELAVPPLTLEESEDLGEKMFTQAGMPRVFRVILPSVIGLYEECKGNIGAVIAQTEKLMADPKFTAGDVPPAANGSIKGAAKKKHGSAGIFITIVCIIIVLACMVPLFMGTSFLSGLFGGSSQQESPQSAVQVSGNTGAGAASSGSNAAAAGSAQGQDGDTSASASGSADQGPVTEEEREAAQTAANPLRASTPTDQTDVKAPEGPKGTESEPVTDDGGLLPDVGEGIESNTPDAQSRNSVTLRGDTLDKIEKSEAGSEIDPGLPQRRLEGSEVKNDQGAKAPEQPKAEKEGAAPVVSRADNALRIDEIAREDEEDRKAAEELAAQQEKQAQADRDEAEKAALEQAQAKAEADKAAAALDDKPAKPAKPEPRQQQRRRGSSSGASSSARVVTGQGIPGAAAELDSKNPGHYSLQVIAGRSRAQVVQASEYVQGRYWVYETVREGKPWYVLVAGDYASPAEAMRQARSLPASLRRGGPFAKTFDRIQSERRLAANGR